jgi:hypothetical protein
MTRYRLFFKMDLNEKVAFIENFVTSVKDELISKIQKGDVPSEWDGHELRSWVHEKFAYEVTSTMRDKRSARAKNFKNELIVRNL